MFPIGVASADDGVENAFTPLRRVIYADIIIHATDQNPHSLLRENSS